MAYISNKERESFIKRINKSYTFRKVLIILEIVLLIGFIAMAFFSLKYADKDTKKWMWWDDTKNTFTTLGICMFAWAITIAVLGVIVVVLILTLQSPKTTTTEVTYLQASALSGKKIKRDDKTTKVFRDRTTSKKKPKTKKK